MTLTNVSTNTSVEVNTTRTPVAQTTVCGDPLGTTDATHPQKVSVTFVGTSFGRGNDVPQLVYVPVDLNVAAVGSAPDAYVTIATLKNAAEPQDDLLQIYDRTHFGEAISVSPSGRFAAVGATHEIVGGKVNVYEVAAAVANSSSTAVTPHTGIWRRVMGMNASAETTSFEGAVRIPVAQRGHRFGGALSISDEFVVVGARLADLVERDAVVNTTNVTTSSTTSHLNTTSNTTYNVTTSTTRQILHYNYSDVADRGAGYLFAIVPDSPTGVTGTVSDMKVAGLQFQAPVNSNAHPVLDYHVRATPLNYSVFNVAIDDTDTGLGFHGHASTLTGVGSQSSLPATNVKFTPSHSVRDYVFINNTSAANVLENLTNGQAYNVTVRARSSVGFSLFSYAMGPFIPATVPDAPSVGPALADQVSAQQAGVVSDGVLRVSATLPAWNGGGIVLEMEASLVPVLGTGSFSERNGRPTAVLTLRTTNATRSFAKPGVSQTWFNFTDLVNGIGYRPRVRVRNWKGWGAYGVAGGISTAANAATIVPAAVPGKPAVVNAVGGNRNITVHFTEPAIESGAALVYRLTVYQENAMVNDRSDTRSWTTDTSPGVVTGLDNGQSYRISVSAANWRGEGLRSDPASDAVIPATTPDGVEGFTVAPGDMHIDVWWRPPKDHGGANVTSYLVWLTAADAAISLPMPVTVQATPGAASYSISFGDKGVSELLESNWIQHTVHVAAANRVGQGVVMRAGTMPVFYGLRPWQTVLVVLFSSGAVAILAWVWKVKRRNPFTCKPLDGVEMKMKTPTGNKVAPEFGAVIGGGAANTVGAGATGSAGGLGFLNMDLGVDPALRDSRLQSNLRAGGSVTVNQRNAPLQGWSRAAAKGGQRIVF